MKKEQIISMDQKLRKHQSFFKSFLIRKKARNKWKKKAHACNIVPVFYSPREESRVQKPQESPKVDSHCWFIRKLIK